MDGRVGQTLDIMHSTHLLITQSLSSISKTQGTWKNAAQNIGRRLSNIQDKIVYLIKTPFMYKPSIPPALWLHHRPTTQCNIINISRSCQNLTKLWVIQDPDLEIKCHSFICTFEHLTQEHVRSHGALLQITTSFSKAIGRGLPVMPAANTNTNIAVLGSKDSVPIFQQKSP